MEIEKIKSSVSDMILEGKVSKDVINTFIKEDGTVLPLETVLWDYKVEFDDSIHGLKKTLKSIVSLYNTYGGYIIYGVSEKIKDSEFVVVGIQNNHIDQQKLRGQFDKYFGKRIPLVYQEIKITINDDDKLVGLLFIPKRKKSERSLAPIIDAADEKSKFILEKNTVYFRTEDECKKVVSTDDFIFISSPRIFGEYLLQYRTPSVYIDHNLPDKSFICPIFVGRFAILNELWAWLADELQHSKVLAADGGKGKTSIAYEFCQLLITTRVEGIEQIIWLTAKNKQFKPIFNEYISMPETHFNGMSTLLKEICIRTGSIENTLEDLSIVQLTKLAKQNLKEYPSFIVIDDVDSSPPEEQKRILEMARTISSESSKILLTTRVNSIYSLDSSILIPGMFGGEFKDLINTLCDRLNLQKLNDKNLSKLEKASEGSPLFSESILRLFKQGSSIDLAIQEWTGKSGEAAREAALKKEVSELSLEAKKVLVTVCTVGSCSKSEIRQLTDLEHTNIGSAIQELDLLFLLNSTPFIESEPRYESSSSISNLIANMVSEIIPEASNFLSKIKKAYYGLQSNSTKYHPRVGEAVRQCNALLKSNRYPEARETLQSLIKDPEFKENKDLYYLSASIEFSDPHADPKTVSNAFQQAYIKGQRKQQFFEQWYDFSLKNESNATVLDICRNAIKSGLYDFRWADRHIEVMDKIIPTITNNRKKKEHLIEAYKVLISSKNTRGYGINRDVFKSKSQKLLEGLILTLDSIQDIKEKAKIILFAVDNGDMGSFTLTNLIDVSKAIRIRNVNDDLLSEKIFNAMASASKYLMQQESKRTNILDGLDEELIKHAKGG
ncbi:helix-turn-helix domain-containing protein [Escherichia coli]|uniref:AlbA family DNA-binding domain-containing protein n=1 Tax=Escherichia coli TaxID=562 RepID=UPI00098C0EF8|nr:ATP-binding protein [Escherichia coli]EGO4446933.1 ATP-binding protein [Escherichia coli]MBB6918212.1 ATP-binding protein [Escherichia coli]CAD5734799.1 Divergent AAA domain [Escherichia coli]CAD5735106.1 Divergent AAA domain [Escherichia coli]HAX2840297.1 ATP-binding protein [Escherichia coli]